MSTDFLTPVGRIVQGDCFNGSDKDYYGKPLVDKNGNPKTSYYVGLAIAKTDPGWDDLWAKITGEAQAGFPGLFDAAGNCTHPEFAFKVIDGDSVAPNTRGVRWCDHEGFPGHYVLKLNSGFPPKCYTAGGAETLVDPERIKRGYFVRVHGNINPNKDQQKPGVFLNFDGVELLAFGEVISTGPSGTEMFGASDAGALPPGASSTPVAGTPVNMGGAAQAPNTGSTTIVMSAPAPGAPVSIPTVMNAPGAPVGTVTPAHDFIPTGGPTPTPAAVGPQPPQSAAPVEVRYRTADGGIYTHAELIGFSFTPDQIAALPTV